MNDSPLPLTPRPLDARLLPVPSTVSPDLQQAIAAPLTEAQSIAEQYPQTPEEWQSLITLLNQASAQRLAQLRQRFPVTVNPLEIAGVKVYDVIPAVIPERNQGRLLVHFHGGGYVLAGGELGMGEGILAAYHGQMRVMSVDYRQGPDHPFPAALEDGMAVMQTLFQTQDPSTVGFLGTSAGGNLLLALMFQLRDQNFPLPSAIAPLSPWADLSETSDSLWVNQGVDRTAIQYPGLVAAMARLYSGDRDLRNPLVSPIYGSFHGFPPTLLISGTRDLFLSDTARLQQKLYQSQIPVELHVLEGLSHGEYLYEFSTLESAMVFERVTQFFDRHLA